MDQKTEHNRIDWIDQVKGFTIFLVVYGHNFPFTEKYIYSFHMPLFIMAAGFFHPSVSKLANIKKRFTSIIIPYFIWSIFLFLVWFFITSKYGENVKLSLSPLKNFIGIFYSQGGREYMDWGIPLWFLPALFVMFLIFHLLRSINNKSIYYTLLVLIPLSGFIYTRFTQTNLPWSINIAMVSLIFYGFGFHFFGKIRSIPAKTSAVLAIVMFAINFILYDYNIKIDMYRAIYGNELLFIAAGVSGSLFVLFFFKALPVFRFLGFVGKFSLTILATQLLAMTFIKFVLLYVFGNGDFDFSEWQRFSYAVLQIALMFPAFYIINKYIPMLNGGHKKI